MQFPTQEFKEFLIEQSKELKIVQNFEDFGFHENLLKGIYAFGFEKPYLIQQKALIPLITKRDTIMQAQSGQGKTVAYTIGVLHLIDPSMPFCQAIIMAPAGEISQPNHYTFCNIGEFTKVRSRCSVGGIDKREQRKAILDGGIHAIFGTPGRILDLIKKNIVPPAYIKILVLDELDEMLCRGFSEQIKEIINQLPSDMQICFSSATINQQIADMAKQVMKDPIKIILRYSYLTLDPARQFYISLQGDNQKQKALMQCLNKKNIRKIIIYLNRKERVLELAQKLIENKFLVSCLYGDLENKRKRTFCNFLDVAVLIF